MDNPEHVKLLHKVNIDITVSPTELSSLKMLKFLRNISHDTEEDKIAGEYHVGNIGADIIEYVAAKSHLRPGR